MMNYQEFIQKHLKEVTIVSILLYPFSLIYCLIVYIRRIVYSVFPFLVYKSKVKIVSVGNITAGGSGKTPFVLFLANHLKGAGFKVAIVLRGYKGEYENKNVLISDDERVFDNVGNAGDEAALYAEKLTGVPICVGKNRIKSIRLLEKRFPNTDFIIMDDAYQYLKVKHDQRFCVFNAISPIGNGLCLPAGILREPCASLKHTDTFVLNGDSSALTDKFLKKINGYGKPVLHGNYTISEIRDFEGVRMNLDELKSKKLILLSGIGTPKSFEKTILRAGLDFQEHVSMNDHFEYEQAFLSGFCSKYGHYDFVLTTEKDFCKLKSLNSDMRILVVCIKFAVEKEHECATFLQKIIRR